MDIDRLKIRTQPVCLLKGWCVRLWPRVMPVPVGEHTCGHPTTSEKMMKANAAINPKAERASLVSLAKASNRKQPQRSNIK